MPQHFHLQFLTRRRLHIYRPVVNDGLKVLAAAYVPASISLHRLSGPWPSSLTASEVLVQLVLIDSCQVNHYMRCP